MSHVVLINIEAMQGRSVEALQVIKRSEESCLSVDGCVSFEALQSQDDEHKFTIIERWSSAENHKTFLDQVKLSDEFVKGMEVFASGPNIEYFNTL